MGKYDGQKEDPDCPKHETAVKEFVMRSKAHNRWILIETLSNELPKRNDITFTVHGATRAVKTLFNFSQELSVLPLDEKIYSCCNG